MSRRTAYHIFCARLFFCKEQIRQKNSWKWAGKACCSVVWCFCAYGVQSVRKEVERETAGEWGKVAGCWDRKPINADEFTKVAMRMQVRDCFAQREVPTIGKVIDLCYKITDFSKISRATFWKLVCSTGLSYNRKSIRGTVILSWSTCSHALKAIWSPYCRPLWWNLPQPTCKISFQVIILSTFWPILRNTF